MKPVLMMVLALTVAFGTTAAALSLAGLLGFDQHLHLDQIH